MRHSSAMKRLVKERGGACVGGFLCFVLLALPAWADDMTADGVNERASAMLERMAEALRTLNYEGTLVYSYSNRLESLHLVHRIENGRVQERLLSLSGPVRAVTRERDRVMCVLPDGESISVKRQGPAGGLLNTEGIDPALLGDYYQIEMSGLARVAGRDAEVIGIIPKDRFRYGYRFYIDQDTGLPLKSDLIDQTGQSLEQLMFTSITVDRVDANGQAVRVDGVRNAPPTQVSGRWSFDERPAGFHLVKHGVMDHPSGAEVEHFLFTDRLSAYSIYIEPDTDDGLSGSTYIGAVHATGRQIDGYQVTAVGEVPAETVQAAIAGARLNRDATP
jgi:sigma-E factor negative regulatory protein RseB